MCCRVQPDRDVFIVEQTPAGPLDPLVGEQAALSARMSSAVGVDATRFFGGPSLKPPTCPGWQEYVVPELNR